VAVRAESNQEPWPQGFRGESPGGCRFALAGPGKVGTSLALWLIAGGAELAAVASRDPRRPLDGRLPAAPRLPLGELSSAGLDLLLLTVADPALSAVAEQLAARPQARVVLHASGPLDARPLHPLRRLGSEVGTLHPLRAFPEVLAAPAPGTFYGLDGDPGAVALGRRLAAAWDGEAAVVPAERRALYHLAATLAAGGVTTVVAAIAELIERAGLPEELLAANLRLMDGALEATRRAVRERAAAAELDRAITGPAARGDLATLELQREALRALAPELLPLVAALQDEALRRGRRLRRRAAPGAEAREMGDEIDQKAISSLRQTPPVRNPERE